MPNDVNPRSLAPDPDDELLADEPGYALTEAGKAIDINPPSLAPDPSSLPPEREGRIHVSILSDNLGFQESLPGAKERRDLLQEHPGINWSLRGVSLALGLGGAFVNVPFGVVLGFLSWSVGLTPIVKLVEYASRLRSRVREKLDRRPAIRLLGESRGRCSDCGAPNRHPERGDLCRVCGSKNQDLRGQRPETLESYKKAQRAVVDATFFSGLLLLLLTLPFGPLVGLPLGVASLLFSWWLGRSDPARHRALTVESLELVAWLFGWEGKKN